MNEEQQQEVVDQFNTSYQQANILQLRLDTSEILERIETFLRGKYYTLNQQGEKVVIETGVPKANTKGIQGIMSYVSNIINPHAVQGNFDRADYDNYLFEIHMDLAETLMNNLPVWEIHEEDYSPIIQFIMAIIIPFMSRLIGNKERESYSHTMRHSESNTVNAGKSGLSLFGGKKE